MKPSLLACLGLSAILSCHAAGVVPPRTEVRSLAREFAAFWDASQDMPEAERNMNGRSEGGLQPRRGYFLGYQIALELGKTRSLDEMAKPSCSAVRPLIGSAITTLKAQAQVHMP